MKSHSCHHSHFLLSWPFLLSPLKVSVISLMNSVIIFLICKPVVLWPSLFSFPRRHSQNWNHSRPHRMEMHSRMGSGIENLWSVISYLGGHIVPGSLVQTIHNIIAVKKEVNFMNFFGVSWKAFLFSWWWNIANAEIIELSSELWDMRQRKTCSFNNCIRSRLKQH